MRGVTVCVLVVALAACALLMVSAECTDRKPPGAGQYSCAQQKGWGKCSASWMKGYCQKTCGKCGGGGGGGGGGSCHDVKPKGSPASCAQQKAWGKCGASWMKGFCKKTCGTCGKGGGSSGSSSSSSGGKKSAAVAALGINASSTRNAPLRANGAQYATNKKRVVAALRAAGLSDAKVKMCLAIAMLETAKMDPSQRDTKKKGDSTNYSLFNINRDMLTRQGISTEGLNSWSGLGATARALKRMIDAYGVNGFLNYLRGGYKGWKDGHSYGAADYRGAIASMTRIIDTTPGLMTDSRRIDMKVKHV